MTGIPRLLCRLVSLWALAAAGLLATTPASVFASPATPYCWEPTPGARIWERPIYCDGNGLIVHLGANGKFDGGDTAQREGWYWLGVWLRANTPGLMPWPHARAKSFEDVLKLLEPNGDGVFYRHPKLPPWNNPFSKEFGTSRDQLVPLIAAMGVYGKTAELQRLWNALPDDITGKHAFNGNWRNFLGQDGPNCGDILKRACNATSDCSLPVDTSSCTREVYVKDCSLAVDNQECSQPQDTTNCPDICILPNVFTGGCSQRVHEPVCEARKLLNNGPNNAKKLACEATKSANNAANAAAKMACESGKASQQAIFDAAKVNCEAEKAGQNAIYAAQKASCETAKTGGKYSCEADKQVAYQTCRVTNVFSGDLIGPATTNLIRRAMGRNPMNAALSDGLTTNVFYGGALGEGELLADSGIRISASLRDKDNVGDDLNHIVHLVLSERRFPSALSKMAVSTYVSARAYSYGSYLGAYYAANPDSLADVTGRIQTGIAKGWKPDATPIYGAVRWYHRPSEGANPELAELWKPIIEHYLK
jgi:hypothetical protein